MKDIKNKFGLRQKSTGKLVGFRVSYNGKDCDGIEMQYILAAESEQLWLVDDPKQAEWVRLNSTPWYNADHGTPTNGFDSDDLEVVEINVTTNVKKVKSSVCGMPTPYEFFKAKYADEDPGHWEYLQKELKLNKGTYHELRYSWYDYLIDRDKR